MVEISVKGPGRQKVFPPVGKCIYCGDTNTPLTEEHIIPFALGGNMILPKASCGSCAKITGGEVEGRLLHVSAGLFGPARLRLKLPTRRPKQRPIVLDYEILDTKGSKRIVSVPIDKVPLILHGYITGLPGALIGRGPTEDCLGKPWTGYNPEHFNDVFKFGDDYSIQVPPLFLSTLARMLAKIAHSLAVATYGIDTFEAVLPPLILGKTIEMFHYRVGGIENESRDPKGMHFLSLGLWPPRNEIVVCIVRLFCQMPSPTYYVVVGKAGTSLRESLLSKRDNAHST